MAAIFISHSSQDNDAAQRLAAWLFAEGYGEPFLDLDPERGMLAGSSWEQQLYRQLRTCDLLLLLWSPRARASQWVFAEITHARALGKRVLPLILEYCELPAILTLEQAIDNAKDKADRRIRLRRALDDALATSRRGHWNPARPPYPGLLAFDELDAPVYFGREAEQRDALAWLTRLQRFDGARLALLLGASGSGKSSLVRAGLVPALRRQPVAWRVAGPMRPQRDPWAELTRALAETSAPHGDACHALLTSAAFRAEPDPTAMAELLRAIVQPGQSGQTELLLVIDQFEELLGLPPDSPGQRLKALLAMLLAQPETPLRILATLRSDMLERLQTDALLGPLSSSDFNLGPLSVAGFEAVIAGPAEVAGLTLEPGLAAEIVSDTATADALPLLAFTLRELWELRGASDNLTLATYRDVLGRLQGAVARAAEAVMNAEYLDDPRQAALRAALVALVRINDDGAYVRQQARWDDLPELARPLLQRFLAKRLLVPREHEGTKLVEFAHDALLRSWRQLADWLAEDRALLVRRDRLRRAAREWEAASRGPSLLVHRGGVLSAAEALRNHPRFSLDASTLAYLDACVAERDAANAFQEAQARRELEAAKALADERQRRLDETNRLRGLSIAQALAAQAPREAQEFGRYERAALLARQAWLMNEAHGGAHIHQVDEALRVVLGLPHFAIDVRAPSGSGAACLAWASDGQSVMAGGYGWLARASATGPGPWQMLSDEAVEHTAVAAAVDGSWVAWGTRRGELWIRHRDDDRSKAFGQHAEVSALVLSPDGRWLASAGGDGVVRLWRPDELIEPAAVWPARDAGVLGELALAFSGDSRWLACAGPDHWLRVWDMARIGARPRWHLRLPCWAKGLAFHPRTLQLAAAGDGGRLVMIDLRGRRPQVDERACWMVEDLAASFDGRHVALALMHGEVALLRAGDEPLNATQLAGHVGRVSKVSYSPDGQRLASAGEDGRIRIWDLGLSPAAPLVRTRPDDVEYTPLALTCDGRRLALTWDVGRVEIFDLESPTDRLALLNRDDFEHCSGALSIDAVAFIPRREELLTMASAGDLWRWDLATRQPRPYGSIQGTLSDMALSPDGSQVATCGHDGQVRIWDLEMPGEPRQVVRVLPEESQWGLRALAFHPTEPEIAVGGDGGRVWRLRLDREGPPTLVCVHGQAYVEDVAYSPDGRWVASAGQDGTARLNGIDGRPGPSFPHERRVNALAFSTDSNWLATACEDSMVRLWRVATGDDSPVVLRGHGESVVALTFADEGRRLVSVDLGGELRTWIPWARELADSVCERVWRNLDAEEWATYVGADVPYQSTCPKR